MKKVSIIVPVYNVDKYLRKCLNSIIKQTYRNIEILIVNDGSTDNSKDICEEFLKIDNRIIYLEKVNGGLSSARNYGLKYMTGEYVFFIDSDDWIELNTIEYLVEKLEENSVDMSICGVYDVVDEVKIKRYADEEMVLTNYQTLDLLEEQGYKVSIVVWNKLYKSDLFNNLEFKEGKINEDVYFTPKAIYLSQRIFVSTVPKYNYLKKREGSICNIKLNKKNFNGVEAEIDNALYFKRNNEEALYYRYINKACGICRNLYCQARLENNSELVAYLEKQYEKLKKQYFINVKLRKNIKEWAVKKFFELNKNLYYRMWRKKHND